jgi:hypothetical protein
MSIIDLDTSGDDKGNDVSGDDEGNDVSGDDHH